MIRFSNNAVEVENSKLLNSKDEKTNLIVKIPGPRDIKLLWHMANSKVMLSILVFLSPKEQMQMQRVSFRFYDQLVPEAMSQMQVELVIDAGAHFQLPAPKIDIDDFHILEEGVEYLES